MENFYTAESRFVGFAAAGGSVKYKVVNINPNVSSSKDQVSVLEVDLVDGVLTATPTSKMGLTNGIIVSSVDEGICGINRNAGRRGIPVWIDRNKIAYIPQSNLQKINKMDKNFSNFMSGSDNATMKSNLVYLGSAALGGYLYMTRIKVLSNSTYNTLLGVGVGLGLGYVLNKYVIK